jgi:hypothetical protein
LPVKLTACLRVAAQHIWHMRCAPALALSFALPAAALAEPVRASYEVTARGLTVMRIEALFDLADPQRYRVETRLRVGGIATAFISGEQVSRVEGGWSQNMPRPLRYSTDGLWRGQPRHILLDYVRGAPVVRRLEPPNDAEREPVPPELAQGTVDTLSALALLARTVRETGRCEARAATYDGRRRTDFDARTLGRDRLALGATWSGEALRCGFEGRQVAGFMRDQPAEWRQPQAGEAWLASLRPGTPPVPVRVELASRWFGTVRASLVALDPATTGQGGE